MLGRHAPAVFDLLGEQRIRCSVRFAEDIPSVEVPPLDAGGVGLSGGSAIGPGASVPNIPNYLVQAILLTLVCLVLCPFTLFFPFLGVITGIVAIVYGAQVNGKVAGGLCWGEGLVATGQGVDLDHVRFRDHRGTYPGGLLAPVLACVPCDERLRLATPRAGSRERPPVGRPA